MEFEKIQPVHVLKVERAGSEQERRRRKADKGFSNLLDSTLEEERVKDEEQDGDQAGNPYSDTVSISQQDESEKEPQLASVDTVQLSLAQRAAAGLFTPDDRAAGEQETSEEAQADSQPGSADAEEDPDEPASIDTLA